MILADEKNSFRLIDRELRSLADEDPIAAVACYALLTQEQKIFRSFTRLLAMFR